MFLSKKQALSIVKALSQRQVLTDQDVDEDLFDTQEALEEYLAKEDEDPGYAEGDEPVDYGSDGGTPINYDDDWWNENYDTDEHKFKAVNPDYVTMVSYSDMADLKELKVVAKYPSPFPYSDDAYDAGDEFALEAEGGTMGRLSLFDANTYFDATIVEPESEFYVQRVVQRVVYKDDDETERQIHIGVPVDDAHVVWHIFDVKSFPKDWRKLFPQNKVVLVEQS